MPDPKPPMGDSTLHSVSVVVVVSEWQGENDFSLNLIRIVIGQSDGPYIYAGGVMVMHHVPL